ncbi:hypothetical protein VNI00_010886 [Paramarasmius palmivorus]|uniref:Uncharacterized protein n=1 Tax=Paramarasmius palmivorus TaxID=297713 RepID=A0AAW0CC93_9AGAR
MFRCLYIALLAVPIAFAGAEPVNDRRQLDSMVSQVTGGAASVFSQATEGAASMFSEGTQGAASLFSEATQDAGSAFTQGTAAAGSLFSEGTDAVAGVVTTVVSAGASIFTVVTSNGGEAITLAGSVATGAGAAITSFAGHQYTALVNAGTKVPLNGAPIAASLITMVGGVVVGAALVL